MFKNRLKMLRSGGPDRDAQVQVARRWRYDNRSISPPPPEAPPTDAPVSQRKRRHGQLLQRPSPYLQSCCLCGKQSADPVWVTTPSFTNTNVICCEGFCAQECIKHWKTLRLACLYEWSVLRALLQQNHVADLLSSMDTESLSWLLKLQPTAFQIVLSFWTPWMARDEEMTLPPLPRFSLSVGPMDARRRQDLQQQFEEAEVTAAAASSGQLSAKLPKVQLCGVSNGGQWKIVPDLHLLRLKLWLGCSIDV